MEKKTIRLGIIIPVILSIASTFTLSTYLVTQAQDAGGGGGGDIPPPPPPPPDPDDPIDPSIVPIAPIIQSISPNPDPDGSIYLKWNLVDGATGYEVYMSKDGGAWQLISTTGSIAIVKGDLTNGDYTFKVRAYNNNGYSVYSAYKSVEVAIPIPLEAPTLYPITPLTDNDGDITLDWSNVNGATFYEIYRSDDDSIFSLIKSGLVNSMYFDLGLLEGYYNYYIIASNGVMDPNPSETKTVQVLIPPPIAPTLLTIWPSMSKTGNVSLRWLGYSNAYNIYRAKDSGSYTLIKSDVSSREYQDAILSKGLYEYYVTAIENLKESEPSNTMTVLISLEQESTSPDPSPENNYPVMILMGFVICIGIVSICLIIRFKR